MKDWILCDTESSLTISKERMVSWWKNPREAEKDFDQTSSVIVGAMNRYSASAGDLETVICFWVRLETEDMLTVMM